MCIGCKVVESCLCKSPPFSSKFLPLPSFLSRMPIDEVVLLSLADHEATCFRWCYVRGDKDPWILGATCCDRRKRLHLSGISFSRSLFCGTILLFSALKSYTQPRLTTLLLCASTVTCATTKTRVLRACDWRKRVVFVVGKKKRRQFEMAVLWHGVGEEGEREEGVTEEGRGGRRRGGRRRGASRRGESRRGGAGGPCTPSTPLNEQGSSRAAAE